MVTTRTGVKQQEPKKQSVLKQLNVKLNSSFGSIFDAVFDAMFEDAIAVYMINTVDTVDSVDSKNTVDSANKFPDLRKFIMPKLEN